MDILRTEANEVGFSTSLSILDYLNGHITGFHCDEGAQVPSWLIATIK